MLFPYGILLIVIFALLIGLGGLKGLLQLLSSEREYLLLFLMLFLSAFYLSLDFKLFGICFSLQGAMLLLLGLSIYWLIKQYFRIDLRNTLTILLIAAIWLFAEFTPYMSSSLLINIGPYIAAPTVLLALLLLPLDFRQGMQGLLLGFILSQLCLCLLQGGGYIVFGRAASLNSFCLATAGYCLLYYCIGNMLGYALNDIY